MKKKVLLQILLCLSVLTFSVCRMSVGSPSTSVAVDPPTSLVKFGDTFSVNVNVTNIVNFTGWQLNLYYTSAVLNCTNATEGPFLNSSGTPYGTSFSKTITNGCLFAYSTILGNFSANGDGVILTVTFKVVGGGSSNLTLADTILADAEIPRQSIPHVDFGGVVNVIAAGHNIAVNNIASYKTVIGQGYLGNITVTTANLGVYPETFNTTVYANQTIITTFLKTNLASASFSTFTFAWNTTGVPIGYYIINATAGPVQNETDTSDNTLTDGGICVTIPGDINGDFKVDLTDLTILAYYYGSNPTSMRWSPNADINGNGVVGNSDLVLMAIHYGQHYP
jgi:hypothetical protein